MAKRTLYIHAGVHKSASTFLQNNIFPFCKNPTYVDYEKFNPDEHGDVLLSCESFVGEPEAGYNAALKTVQPYFDDFDRVKVLFLVRRQDAFCASMYVQQLHEGGVKSPLEYIRLDSGAAKEEDVVYVGDLDWGRMINNIQAMFPKLEVTVIPFELIKTDYREFMRRIFHFLESEEFTGRDTSQNRSYSKMSCEIALVLNRFFKSPRNPGGLIPQRPFFGELQARRDRNLLYRLAASISYRMTVRYALQHVLDRLVKYRKPEILSGETKEGILEICREGNAVFDEQFDLNLREYGYY